MTTVLLAALTILLALILIVLFCHLPEDKRRAFSSFLDACFSICWIALLVVAGILAATIQLIEDGWGAGLPYRIWLIPWLVFTVSCVPFAIAYRKELGWREVWRIAKGCTIAALIILVVMWGNPPSLFKVRPFFHLPRELGVFIDLIVLSAITFYLYREWQKSEPDLIDRIVARAGILLGAFMALPGIWWLLRTEPDAPRIIFAVTASWAVILLLIYTVYRIYRSIRDELAGDRKAAKF